jgi:hypothetical protein
MINKLIKYTYFELTTTNAIALQSRDSQNIHRKDYYIIWIA